MVGMTVLGDAPVEGDDGFVFPGVEGDRFEEWPAAALPADFDWLNDVRVVPSDDLLHPLEMIEAMLQQATVAIDVLADLDTDRLDGERLTQVAVGVERLRRKVDRAGVAVAGHVDDLHAFRDDGFFNAKTWLKHRLQLLGPEAHRRVQTARMHRRVPLWADAELSGLVGVSQTELMARAIANPRIADEAIDQARWGLLNVAMDLSYSEFERNVKTWEMLADPEGAKTAAQRLSDRRDVKLRPLPDGGWNLTGTFDEISGVEFNEILSHFIDIEWRSDWDEARQRLGDKASITDMCRTEPQRRADALLAMARTAAQPGAGAGGGRSGVTVNMLIDNETFEATIKSEPIEPDRWRDVVCRTDTGRRLHPDDVVNTALWGKIRRVVYDSAGVIIDLGRRSRLFTGSARDAVMLLANKCVWIGCDQSTVWCQADHSQGWKTHGATVPRNGQPLCGGHNRRKEHGYQVYRDSNGDWHTIHPNGHEIL
jgi:hypothetical protein